MPANSKTLFESQFIAHVRRLRGQAVILDSDLAWFLGIEPERIADVVVKRPELFPPDFVFHLKKAEMNRLQKEFPCLTLGANASLKPRVAFSTHGVGMLLLAFQDDEFALAAIPVLRAIQKFWQAEEAAPTQLPARKS